jgi:hypothetical protein
MLVAASVLISLIRQELRLYLSFHITWPDPNLYRNPGLTLKVQRNPALTTQIANPKCCRAHAVEMILLSPK